MLAGLHVPALALVLALSAADPGVDSARSASVQARAQLQALQDQQTALRVELNAVGDRIAALKARAGRQLLGSPELDAALRRSQELSEALGALAGELSTARAAAEERDRGLVSALTGELGRVRDEILDSADRERRRGLLERMRALRAERDRVRGTLPADALPAIPEARSDDPEDLLQEADALRDAQDKVDQRIRALDARIAEAKAERELDRRVREFADDESMFDEQDRRFGTGSFAERGAQFDAFGGPTASPVGGTGGPGTPTAGSSGTSSSAVTTPDNLERAPGTGAQADDGLESLEAERAKLRALSGELRGKAQAAEDKARTLE